MHESHASDGKTRRRTTQRRRQAPPGLCRGRLLERVTSGDVVSVQRPLPAPSRCLLVRKLELAFEHRRTIVSPPGGRTAREAATAISRTALRILRPLEACRILSSDIRTYVSVAVGKRLRNRVPSPAAIDFILDETRYVGGVTKVFLFRTLAMRFSDAFFRPAVVRQSLDEKDVIHVAC